MIIVHAGYMLPPGCVPLNICCWGTQVGWGSVVLMPWSLASHSHLVSQCGKQDSGLHWSLVKSSMLIPMFLWQFMGGKKASLVPGALQCYNYCIYQTRRDEVTE